MKRLYLVVVECTDINVNLSIYTYIYAKEILLPGILAILKVGLKYEINMQTVQKVILFVKVQAIQKYI